MSQKYRLRTVVLFLSISLLSACSDSSLVDPDKEPQDETPAQEQTVEEPSVVDEPTIPDEFYELEAEMYLSPGETLDLGIPGAMTQSANPEWLIPMVDGTFQIAKDAPIGESTILTVELGEEKKEIQVTFMVTLEDTIVDVDGVPTVTNPSDLLVVVNKERNLPADYVPEGLMPPNIPFYFSENIEKRWLRPEAAKAIEEMFAIAKEDGIKLIGASAYRSYKTQVDLFNRYVKTHGLEEANTFSARPGQSEHQTGLTIDVYHPNITNGLEKSFGATPEGIWVAEHAHEFGFIIRYPEGKEEITGYMYEPWHLRYVGTTVAKEIYEKGITLEEYFLEKQQLLSK